MYYLCIRYQVLNVYGSLGTYLLGIRYQVIYLTIIALYGETLLLAYQSIIQHYVLGIIIMYYVLHHLFQKNSFRQRDLATCVLGIRSYIQQEYSFMENPECLLITWYLVLTYQVLGIKSSIQQCYLFRKGPEYKQLQLITYPYPYMETPSYMLLMYQVLVLGPLSDYIGPYYVQ